MINRSSSDWQEVESRVQERIQYVMKGLKSGDKANEYQDVATRWENIGIITALEWVLSLPNRE